ncbi:hypothetical protein MHH56_09550 [Paenibacillus sp. FSL K6-3182]|uniref:hypothetical protein n=1 Tax=Paenibacillus sp. FSL K6-3182 TaxID=2921495 RepID=UPI0030D03CD2
MKRILITLAACLLLITGCSKAQPEPTTTSTTTPIVEVTQSPIPSVTPQPTEVVPVVPSAEEAVKKYYDSVIKKDYDTLATLLYEKNLDISATEWVKQMKDYDFKER